MTRFLRLFWFHFKLYYRNQYFLWLMFSSTVSIVLLQYVIAYSNKTLSQTDIWTTGGIFGLWASATTATGVIGFQRHQGTLPYLINTAVGDRMSFVTLILPASVFGLLAFPVAIGTTLVLGGRVGGFSLMSVVYILLLWIASFVLDLFIASFFVLTKHAIVYEEIISLPILLVSGLFGFPDGLTKLNQIVEWVSPLAYPIHALHHTGVSGIGFLGYLVSIMGWLMFTSSLFRRILKYAKQQGSLNSI